MESATSFRASVLAGRVVRMSRVRGGMSSRFSVPLAATVGGVDVMVVDLDLDLEDLAVEDEDEEEDGERDSGGSGGGT